MSYKLKKKRAHSTNYNSTSKRSKANIRFAVVHSDNFEAAEEFMREVKEVLHTEDVYIDRLSLSVACHIGPGALAVACMIVE